MEERALFTVGTTFGSWLENCGITFGKGKGPLAPLGSSSFPLDSDDPLGRGAALQAPWVLPPSQTTTKPSYEFDETTRFRCCLPSLFRRRPSICVRSWIDPTPRESALSSYGWAGGRSCRRLLMLYGVLSCFHQRVLEPRCRDPVRSDSPTLVHTIVLSRLRSPQLIMSRFFRHHEPWFSSARTGPFWLLVLCLSVRVLEEHRVPP